MEFLGHNRAGVAHTSAALGEDSKGFGRGVERKLNGTKIEMHESDVRNTQRQGCVRSFRIVSGVIDVYVLGSW